MSIVTNSGLRAGSCRLIHGQGLYDLMLEPPLKVQGENNSETL